MFLSFRGGLVEVSPGFLKRPWCFRRSFFRVNRRNFHDRDGFVDVVFLSFSRGFAEVCFCFCFCKRP